VDLLEARRERAQVEVVGVARAEDGDAAPLAPRGDELGQPPAVVAVEVPEPGRSVVVADVDVDERALRLPAGRSSPARRLKAAFSPGSSIGGPRRDGPIRSICATSPRDSPTV
jgi:hypothetical protein